MKQHLLKTLFYNENNKLNGAFKFISKITKHEDIHSSRDIEISVISNYSAGNIITRPLGIPTTGDDYWASDDNDTAWYKIDLRSYKISVKGYEYHTGSFDYFQNWYLMGSNNGYQWTILDKRGRSSYPSAIVIEPNYYKCSENVNDAFTYIKLQVSGLRNFGTSKNLAIHNLELYGNLYTNSLCTQKTCNRGQFMFNWFCFIVINR